jgi:methylmalonyl-CoA/ethylmalonyl-CoA epimerase
MWHFPANADFSTAPDWPRIQNMSINQIGQISITVQDLDRAVTFYRDKLGMKHLFTVPGMAFFDCGGIRLMLAIPTSAELDHPSSILYFKVPDIQAAHDTLSSRGVPFIGKPHFVAPMATHDLWLAEFRDSEKNVMSLMGEVPKKA